MARKGKEPAGLRRYRLAQKRKKAGRKRKVRAAPTRRKTTMARRRSRRKGSRRKDKRVPITVALPVIYPFMEAYAYSGGDLKYTLTGGANAFVPVATYKEQGMTAAAARAAQTWVPITFGALLGRTSIVKSINKRLPAWLPIKV